MKKGGRSHYSGPGKGKEAPSAKRPTTMPPHAAKQAGHGPVNKNPRSSVHKMVF